MSIFGSLGNFRGLAIAGGSAAERISQLEKEREDKIFSGIQNWVKETIPRAGEYRTKATVLRRKIEGQLEQVVDKYLGDSNLTESQKIAGARALLKDHGNKIENIDKAYSDAQAMGQILYESQPDAFKKANRYNPITTSSFVNTRLANLGNLKTKESLQDASLYATRTNLGDFNDTPEGIIKALSIYDGSNIFRSGYDEAQLKNITAPVTAGLDEYRGEMPELARVERVPVISTLEAMQQAQKYRLNEAQLAKYISDIEKGTETGVAKWKPSDWRGNYKTIALEVSNKVGFEPGELSFSEEGYPMFPMGSGKPRKEYAKAKQRFYNESFSNFVKGAIGANAYDTPAFKSVAYGLANNVSVTEVPLQDATKGISPDNINYNNLLSGNIYQVGANKGIYIEIDPSAKKAKDRGLFSIVPK